MDKLALALAGMALVYACFLYVVFNFQKVVDWFRKPALSRVVTVNERASWQMQRPVRPLYGQSDRMAA